MALLKYLRENHTEYDAPAFANLHVDMKRHGIKVTYESFDVADAERRVIFSSSGQRKITEMTSEANGMVLLNVKGKWSPLVIPFRTMRTDIDFDFVSVNLDKYRVMKVKDGTIINLYWYDGWKISTSKGYDVTDLAWKKSTYMQVLSEVLQHTGWDNLFDLLDKKKSHTFGFRHPEFHPMDGKPYDFWYVQSVVVEDEKFSPAPPDAKFPTQEEVVIESLPVVFRNLKDSLDVFLDSGSVNFGYIIRGEGVPAEHASMFLESALMKKVRILHYNNRVVHNANQLARDVNTHIVLSGFLNPDAHKLFITLFPKYEPIYEKLQHITKQLIRSTTWHFGLPQTAKKIEALPENIQKAGLLLKCKFVEASGIRPGSPSFKSQIAEFILDDKFSAVFYDILTAPEERQSADVLHPAAAAE